MAVTVVRIIGTSALFVLGALAFACGSEGSREDAANGNGTGAGSEAGAGNNAFGNTGPSGNTNSAGTDGGNAALSCNDPANAVEGCGCPAEGNELACWTGPANLRRVDMCREGKSVCVKSGEGFLRWGPCTGQVLPGSPGVDANCQANCKGECNPGTSRWCDEPNFCAWGKQDCLPNAKGGGSWGPCKEVPPPAGCEPVIAFPGFPAPYEEDCCKKLGFCCQVGGVNSPLSEGNCAGIVTNCQ